MGEVMREAAFSLSEAKFTARDLSTPVIQNVNGAQVKIRMKKDNVTFHTTLRRGRAPGKPSLAGAVWAQTEDPSGCGYFLYAFLLEKEMAIHSSILAWRIL